MADFQIRQAGDSFEFVPCSDKGHAWSQKTGQFEDIAATDNSIKRSQATAKGFKALLLQSGLTVEDTTGLDHTDQAKRSPLDSPTAQMISGSILLIIIIGAFIYGASLYNEQRRETAAEQQRKDEAEAAEEASKRDENRQKGFNCLSSWDGSEPDVVNLVKDRLRDPNSFEHIETRITPKDAKGAHHLTMRYRSRNGFGGMTEGIATATVLNFSDRCVASLTALE